MRLSNIFLIQTYLNRIYIVLSSAYLLYISMQFNIISTVSYSILFYNFMYMEVSLHGYPGFSGAF